MNQIRLTVFLMLLCISNAGLAENILSRCVNQYFWYFTRNNTKLVEIELKKLKSSLTLAAQKEFIQLNSCFCTGAALLLYEIIKAKHMPIEPEVFTYNFPERLQEVGGVAGHTVLRVKDFFGPGKDMIIDGTWTQFKPEVAYALDDELIFVGTESEYIDNFKRFGIDSTRFTDPETKKEVDNGVFEQLSTWKERWRKTINFARENFGSDPTDRQDLEKPWLQRRESQRQN